MTYDVKGYEQARVDEDIAQRRRETSEIKLVDVITDMAEKRWRS
jgi:hypothetical protein